MTFNIKQTLTNILKRNRAISVGNLEAFGSVYYSEREDKLLLIAKRHTEGETEENFFEKLKKAFLLVLDLAAGNQKMWLGAYTIILVNIVYPLVFYNYFTSEISYFSYLLFILTAVLVGVLLAKTLYSVIHDAIARAEFKEVVLIDDKIGDAIKQKLRKDITYTTILTLLIFGTVFCFPREGVSYIRTYMNFMPADTSSFFILEICTAILSLAWLFSPIGLKIRAYKKVKELQKGQKQ